MREPKPYWRDVPKELRSQIETIVGSPIRHATQIFGGYGPSATFRLFLEDGRTIFAKGAGTGSITGNWQSLPNEEAVYRQIEAIRPMSPNYFGSVKVDGWHLLLLEDLQDVMKVPPWSEELAKQAMKDIAAFHLRGIPEAGKVPLIEDHGLTDNWQTIKSNQEERQYFLDLFGETRSEAEEWLHAVIDPFIQAEAELLRQDQPWGLIHKDIRSDNLCFKDGNMILFDWALACKGPLLFDIGFFLPSMEGEGGPSAESLFLDYKNAMATVGINFPLFCEHSVAAATAGFFATRAGKPHVAVLPRLRTVQRLQLGPALRIASSLLNLPQPPKTILV